MSQLLRAGAAGILLLVVACAQENVGQPADRISVPDGVKSAFQAGHPDVEGVKWEEEGRHFEAEYRENRVQKAVVYEAGGKLIATETEVPVSDLPPPIGDYLGRNYPRLRIGEAERVDTNRGTFYEVELQNGNQEIELRFDRNGNFIERETEVDGQPGGEDSANGPDE